MLTYFAVLIDSVQRLLEAFARAFRLHFHVQKMQAIASKLSRLTFIEALLLRAGYMLSLIALLLYIIVGCFLA
jgi:hypothetical protein